MGTLADRCHHKPQTIKSEQLKKLLRRKCLKSPSIFDILASQGTQKTSPFAKNGDSFGNIFQKAGLSDKIERDSFVIC